MYTKYVDYELIKLFESEPILISEKEAGMFIYSKEDSLGMKLILSFSIYEKKSKISLGLGDSEALEISFKDVKELRVQNDSLIICQNQSEKDCVIHFRPNFFINFEYGNSLSIR